MAKTLKRRSKKGKVSFRNNPNIYNLTRNNSRGRIRPNNTNTNYLYRLSTKNEYNNEQKYLAGENARRKMYMLKNATNYVNKIESKDVNTVFEGLRIKDKYKKPSQYVNFTTIDTNDKYPTPEQYTEIKNYMANNNTNARMNNR